MFCYCGGELKLLSNKNFVCNKCSTVFKECEDGIYSDNNFLVLKGGENNVLYKFY